MNSYWELSEKERAALTENEVEALSAYELMSEGVLKPPPLVLADEPEMPEPDGFVYVLQVGYHSRDIAWATAEEAAASIEGRAGKVETEQFGEYPNTISINRVVALTDSETELVKRIPIYSDELLTEVRSAVEKAATTIAENARLRKTDAEAREKHRKALTGMWEDWHRCREKAASVEKLLETLAEYETLTGGNKTMAIEFLSKAFEQHEIDDALEWRGEAAA